MRVLHIYKTSYPTSFGGVETFIHNLCTSTQSTGIKNCVISLTKVPTANQSKHLVYKRLELRTNFSISSNSISFEAIFKFRKLANASDIIHLHHPYPFADFLYFLWGRKKPLIVTYHSDVVRQKFLFPFYMPLQRWMLRKAKCIVVTSKNYLDTSHTLSKFQDKTKIIPIGLPSEIYLKPDQSSIKHWKSKLPEKFILYLGADRSYKNLKALKDAVEGQSIHLVLIGTQVSNTNESLENIIELGQISEVDKVAILNLCTALILPSNQRSEAFGICLLEAAACGKPLICCELQTGTTFINLHMKTGLVIQPNSAKCLTASMRYILANPDLSAKMGKNAQKRQQKIFNLKSMSDRYLIEYRKIVHLPHK